ncbi:MAG: ABC transporter [Cyanobacteriota bacterium]
MRALAWPRRRLPLAWLQLRRQPVKVLVAVHGQTMAGTLIFLQLGLLQALFDASVLLHRQLNADLVVLAHDSPALVTMQAFSSRRLAQAYGHPAVAELNIGAIPWRSPRSQAARSLLAVGLDPAQPGFVVPALAERLQALKPLHRFLPDGRARPEFAPMVERIRRGDTVRLEVNGQRLTSAGLASVGTSFGVDGFVLMSQDTFRQLRPQEPRGAIELGLIQLRPGADPEQVRRDLRALLPRDVEVLTHQGHIQREFAYWARNTVAAFVLGLGALIGFLAGIMVVYQIIYADVSDNLPVPP